MLAGLLAVVSLATLERTLNTLRASDDPAWGASWIWADVPLDQPQPLAFLAVREFELAALPNEAWLQALADESFILFLNGVYVGAGSYTDGAPLARYRVEKFLRLGSNRLVVELRSRRGVGGFLANLVFATEGALATPVVVTDAEWKIFRRDERVSWRAGVPLLGGEAARVWHQPPTGRWRLQKGGQDLPIPLHGKARPRRMMAQKKRALYPQGVLYSWEEEVDGFLLLNLPSPDTPPALAWFGEEEPDPMARSADEFLIFLPGQRQWRDLHSRCFKHLLLVGLEPPEKPQVRLLAPQVALRLRPPQPRGGVWGLTPPAARSAAEMAIWKRLQE